MMKDEKSPEAVAIIAKLKKGKGGDSEPDPNDPNEAAEGEKDGAGDEAKNAAAEDLFQALRGRAPSEEERGALIDAFEALATACGGY